MTRRLPILILTAAAMTLAGCTVGDPYGDDTEVPGDDATDGNDGDADGSRPRTPDEFRDDAREDTRNDTQGDARDTRDTGTDPPTQP